MENKVMSKITITKKIKSLPRDERLFCALFNKYRWLSELNKHPLTTYRGFENPNQLDLEFELIEIDNYLMNHAKEGNHNRIWYKDSWIVGIQNWLKKTKRAKINPDLFVSIDDMVEKDEESQTELQGLEKGFDEAINSSWESVYCSDWDDVLAYIVGDLNQAQLVSVWWGPQSNYIRSRVLKAKSRIKYHNEFCGWVYSKKDIPDIVGTYIVGIWAGEYDVDIIDEDYPPKKQPVQVESKEGEPQEEKLCGTIPIDMIPGEDDPIISFTELKEQLIAKMQMKGDE
tara:strand:- start:3824 stop:4678 length:855 start_codon:yes stop_codon:yes gene_type:complete